MFSSQLHKIGYNMQQFVISSLVSFIAIPVIIIITRQLWFGRIIIIIKAGLVLVLHKNTKSNYYYHNYHTYTSGTVLSNYLLITYLLYPLLFLFINLMLLFNLCNLSSVKLWLFKELNNNHKNETTKKWVHTHD